MEVLQKYGGSGKLITEASECVARSAHASRTKKLPTQHEIANKVLTAIIEAAKTQGKPPLTYKSVALELGYTPDYSRAVAQACDLLDAAAAWAGVPLFALTRVLSSDGRYNLKAFGRPQEKTFREAIFERSAAHHFTDQDFGLITEALNTALGDVGNRYAWKRIYGQFGGRKVVLGRLAGGQPLQADALNDLDSGVPDIRTKSIKTFLRDEKVRRAVLRRAKGRCEFCGEQGFKKSDGDLYLECHHIICLADDGADLISNVIALCSNHHREAHYGEDSEDIEKKMIAIVAAKLKLRGT